jgi:hypothetical protein
MQLAVTFALLAHMLLQVSHLAHLALLDTFPLLQDNLLALEPTHVTQAREQSQVHRHQQMDAQIVMLVLFKLPPATFLLHAVRVI